LRAINLTPYQGLKQKLQFMFPSLSIASQFGAINLTPYQGLKQKLQTHCTRSWGAINLTPYLGLKHVYYLALMVLKIAAI
jgi:uncharacterized protein with beta-barrel porin domain